MQFKQKNANNCFEIVKNAICSRKQKTNPEGRSFVGKL